MTALQETQDRKTIGGVVLTAKQREVLDLIGKGRTNPEIAEELGISLDGAKWHVSELLTKLGVDTRDEAASWWRQQHSLATRLRAIASFATLKWLAAGVGVAAAAVAAIAILVLIASGEDEGRELALVGDPTVIPTVDPDATVTPPAQACTPSTSVLTSASTTDERFVSAWRWDSCKTGSLAWPVVAGDRVYVSISSVFTGENPSVQPGVLVALDAQTGSEVWRFDTTSGPFAATVSGSVVVFGTADGTVHALDTATGIEQWSVNFPGVPFQIVTAGDALIVADSDPENQGPIGLVDKSRIAGHVWAIDAASGDVRWTIDGEPDVFRQSFVAATGDIVAIGAGDSTAAGEVFVVEAASGAERWRISQGAVSSPPAATETLAIVANSDGSTRAHNLSDGSQAWAVGPANGGVHSFPTVQGESVVLASNTGSLEGRRLADGSLVWTGETGDCIVIPVLLGVDLYINHCSVLTAVVPDATTGTAAMELAIAPQGGVQSQSAGDGFMVISTSIGGESTLQIMRLDRP